MKTLQEMTEMDRMATLVKNLDQTIKSMMELMKSGVAPSSEQLKQIWLAHDALGEAYNEAEKVRRKT